MSCSLSGEGGSSNVACTVTALSEPAVTTPGGLSGPPTTPIESGSSGALVSLPVTAVPGFGECDALCVAGLAGVGGVPRLVRGRRGHRDALVRVRRVGQAGRVNRDDDRARVGG